ncbi:glutathione transferase GstA [Rhodoferax saidenbachensis]|uniref:Glutathione S-transferase n=1 Tax=Rhodoferax saidenbachensis TaxID=1484693 RepID=A0A1P8K530_9BURK|nr:glutathione transferase GstA [Rhodoferax saidenbachensis]APW41124.1 glutathione S-transferase [Rhodoferax saidenbachensis]
MKLYYSAGACSLSPHIALHEAGLAFEAVLAPTKTHKLPDGGDYYAVNPLGYVPLLELDNGVRLREGPAIVQYIADQVPEKKLAPANGTLERYQLQSWLTFIGTEIHKTFSPLFNPATPAETRAGSVDKLANRLKWVDGELAGKQYLMGDQFTVADGYLFTVTNWANPTGVDLSAFTNLLTWRARVGARPAVVAAMKAEGLLK